MLAAHRETEALPTVTFDSFLGTGQMSRTARFGVAWPDGGDPSSIVVKVPSTDDGTRQYGFEHGPYLTEHVFYQAVASEVDVASVGVHGLFYDQASSDFAFVLEDMVGYEPGDQFAEPDGEQLTSAIEQAVALQARAWGRPTEAPFATLTGDREGRAARTKMMLQAFLPSVVERLGHGLDDGIADLMERFADAADVWGLRQSTPMTLVHGDYRPDNFMYGPVDSTRRLVIVDWQTLRMGRGVTDVAYLLGGALDPGHRAQIEREVVVDYRNRLSACGINYPEDQCLTDYALASLHGVAIAVGATMLADQTERGDALFTMMLNRHGRHALDWEAMGLLTQ